MSTTLHVDMKKWAGTEITGPITLTYDGASPTDPGPAGTVARMLIAQVSNDPEGLKDAVTAATLEMGKPNVPGKDLVAHIGEVTEEGDRRVVPCKMTADGSDQEIAFLLVEEAGGWRIDMPATIERLMGASMADLGAMMEEGMKKMGEGMAAAMEGLGEGMAQAFGSSDSDGQTLQDLVPAHPDLAAFRQGVIDLIGVKWHVDADWYSFGVSDGELGAAGGMFAGPLEEALKGIERFARSGGAGIAQLEAVKEFRLRKSSVEIGNLRRQGDQVVYAIGDDGAGGLVTMPADQFARELHEQVADILG